MTQILNVSLGHAFKAQTQQIRIQITKNRDYLMKIRSGEVEMDAVLDFFDEKLSILEGIGEDSALAPEPDQEWIDSFVMEQYEKIVRA